ncbi:MAG: hypothetical protein HDR98_10215 [Bacteroides sp.]|nr:hypothetical protein [Bacteroides sp.]
MTPLGKSVMPLIEGLVAWAMEYKENFRSTK